MSFLQNSKNSEQIIWIIVIVSILIVISDIILQVCGYAIQMGYVYGYMGTLSGMFTSLRGFNKKEDTKRESYAREIVKGIKK